MFDLTGKTALVTGATGGIGGAIAKAMHAQGATVILSGRNQGKLDELAAELGERVHTVACDLSNLDSIDSFAAEAEAKTGQIDILVNNAGITRDGLMMRMSDEDWQSVINTNLTSAFKLSRAIMKGMMKRRYGRIMSVASIVGAQGNAGQANYAASKAGLIGMSKSLAMEVAPRGITVNTIAPGFIVTPMTDVLPDAVKEALLGQIPAKKLGTSEDIAAGAVFLASEEAGYMTGQTLHINGGMARF